MQSFNKLSMILPIILSTILIILVVIFLFHHLKRNKEGLKSVTGASQPPVMDEIYDHNLRQAQSIWKTIGCLDGSYKPTNENRAKDSHWAKEDWKEELKAYYNEAQKLSKEHNYYDFIGKDINNKPLKIGIRDAVGIGEAYNRCIDKTFKTTYNFPKDGDRIKIKKTLTDDSDYYTGIVLKGNVNEASSLDVLWDQKGKGNTMVKDTSRTNTSKTGVQHKDLKILADSKEFGWPYYEWNRHPSKGEQYNKKVAETKWIQDNDLSMKVDSKIVYKTTQCLNDTKCDNLNCKKRKEEILDRYPITYYCKGEPRNDRPLGKGHICMEGDKKGMVTQYFEESTMCFKDEKGNSYGRSFCKDECGASSCENYNDENRLKLYKGDDCYAVISDKVGFKGNRAIIRQKKIYKTADLKKLGITDGIVRSIQIYGKEFCSIRYKTDGKCKTNKKKSEPIKIENGTSIIQLYKEKKGCGLTLYDKNRNPSAQFINEDNNADGLNGTSFNKNQIKEKTQLHISEPDMYGINSIGGGKVDDCHVDFYGENQFDSRFNLKHTGRWEDVRVKNIDKIRVFKKPKPILNSGTYRIVSRRTGNDCYTYDEVDFWGDKTGKVFWQCDNTGNGKRKDNYFQLELIDPTNPYGYYISQDDSYCKHQQIGAGYNIKCDREGEGGSPNATFEIKPIGSTTYMSIKNAGTGKYCRNRKDIVMPGGGIMACDWEKVPYSGWGTFEFIKV
jgi:hypothetical protein